MNQPPERADRRVLAEALNPVSLLVPPAVVTAVMWFTRTNQISAVAALCAHIILQVAWGSYLTWKNQSRGGLPVFAMVAAVYWVYFALELFWGERTMFATRLISVSEESVTQAVEMALLGVVSMYIGTKTSIASRALSSVRLPEIDEHAKTSFAYIGGVTALGAAVAFYPDVSYLLGSEGRQIMVILTTTVPTVAFALLLRRYIVTPTLGERSAVAAIGGSRLLGGLASGWLGPVVSLGLTAVALVTVIRRKIPWTPILLTAATIVFLQAGKEAFRSEYWSGAGQGISDESGERSTLLERAAFWVQTSASQWSEALKAGGKTKSTELASRTTQRTSLLTQVAHVLDMTPSQVPYQGGETYFYLGVTLIPRFLWPDKPTVSEANRFYQIAFGLSDQRSLQYTSISVGSMAEAYINFGWLGVAGIMFLLGMILSMYQRFFFSSQTNGLLLAIGAAMLPQFLAIEGQLAQYIGGMVQQMVFSFLVFLPITKRRAPIAAPSGPTRHSVAPVRVY